MVKEEVFEWIRTGQKTIELRKGRAREAIKQSVNVEGTVSEEGSVTDVLRQDNYKNIIPIAHSLEETITHLKGLCGTVEGRFTTFLKPSHSLFKSYYERV